MLQHGFLARRASFRLRFWSCWDKDFFFKGKGFLPRPGLPGLLRPCTLLYINITSAWAVDREFVNIYWAHLGPNFTQVGSNWSRIGSNWLPIWTPFGPQGIPLAPLGPHWEPDRFGDRFGNLASSQVRCLRIRSAFLELTKGMTEMVARRAPRSPPPHALGVRMTVVTQTPSNYYTV